MGLNVKFDINKTELLVGEHPICILTLENTGPELLKVIHPDCGKGMPCFRLTEVKSGAETFIRGETSRGSIAEVVELALGQKLQSYISLLDAVDLRTPGEYAISVVYSYNDDRDQAESEPVRIKIRHFSSRNLFLNSVRGSVFEGVFISPAADPPDVVLANFSIKPNGGFEGVHSVGKATLMARPCLSLPPNKASSLGSWIAWIDKGKLVFTHFDTTIGASKVAELKLGTAQAEIIPPLYIEPDSSSQTNGAALVWMDGLPPNQSSIQMINLEREKAKVRARLAAKIDVAGDRPKWMMSHVLSDGTKLVTFIRSTEGTLSLYLTTWPDRKAPAIGLRKLLDWKADFVASGATLGLSDEIYGASLVWTGPEHERKLELIGWTIEPKGPVKEHYRQVIPWSPLIPIGAANVRVRAYGTPALLILALDDYSWSVWDGFKKELTPLPEPYTYTKMPMDIAFLNQRDVVLICAEAIGGFSVKQMDGSNLPPYPI